MPAAEVEIPIFGLQRDQSEVCKQICFPHWGKSYDASRIGKILQLNELVFNQARRFAVEVTHLTILSTMGIVESL